MERFNEIFDEIVGDINNIKHDDDTNDITETRVLGYHTNTYSEYIDLCGFVLLNDDMLEWDEDGNIDKNKAYKEMVQQAKYIRDAFDSFINIINEKIMEEND